mmetsp:Transcript_51154/g.121567  ORF Transcript_51154/g.121567 Transcript_51154/m.121567 type:complete len:461 (-) Transcript_51154:207-1589(-)
MQSVVRLSGEDVKLSQQESVAWRLAGTASGFLADSYDLFAIDLVILLLGFIYGEAVIGAAERSFIVGAMIGGVIVGMLTFGFIADWFGRKWTFVLTAALTVLSAAASACCVHRPGSLIGLPQQLTICRFCLGIGVGGEYPLVAAVTSETAHSVNDRGWYMAIVLSMQGFGMLLSSLLAIGALQAEINLEATWRLLLAFGAVPSLVAFFMRWHMHESEAFEKAATGGANSTSNSLSIIRRHWRTLLGTSACWLFANMSLYSLGSFKSTILSELVPPAAGTPAASDALSAANMSALTSVFAIVGWILALLAISRVSRYHLQFCGFLNIAALLAAAAVLALRLQSVPSWVFIVIMGLMFTLHNCGPNITTFIVPAEAFPTCVRATCHGISAASGKVGAAIGTIAFPQLEAAHGLPMVFAACSIASLLGASLTLGCTPKETLDIEELEGENAPLACSKDERHNQ